MFPQPERLALQAGSNKEETLRVIRRLTSLHPSVRIKVALFVDTDEGHEEKSTTLADREAIMEQQVLLDVSAHSGQRTADICLSFLEKSVHKVHLGKSLSGPAHFGHERNDFFAEDVDPFGMFAKLPHDPAELLRVVRKSSLDKQCWSFGEVRRWYLLCWYCGERP